MVEQLAAQLEEMRVDWSVVKWVVSKVDSWVGSWVGQRADWMAAWKVDALAAMLADERAENLVE